MLTFPSLNPGDLLIKKLITSSPLVVPQFLALKLLKKIS